MDHQESQAPLPSSSTALHVGNLNIIAGNMNVTNETNVLDQCTTTTTIFRNSNANENSRPDRPMFLGRYPLLAALIAAEGLYSSIILDDVNIRPGTRVGIIDRLISSIDSDNSEGGFFVLTGLVGTGKTALCKYVAVELEKRGTHLAGAYFFHPGHSKNTLGNMILTFVASLARLFPEYGEIVETTLLQKYTDQYLDRNSSTLWGDLVLNPLQSVLRRASNSRFMFVIDGLDECDPGRRATTTTELKRFLHHDLLEFRQQFKSFVWVISSRPTELLRGFVLVGAAHPLGLVRIDLTTMAESHRDIATVIEQELTELTLILPTGLSGLEQNVQRIRQFLTENAHGQFAFVNQTLRYIQAHNHSPANRIRDLLNRESAKRLAFRDLDRIYARILNGALNNGKRTTRELRQNLLYLLAFLDFPVTIVTLCFFWRVTWDEVHEAFIPLLAVLSVGDEFALRCPIKLIPSFRHFLITEGRSQEYVITTDSLALDAFAQSLIVAGAHSDPYFVDAELGEPPELPQDIFAAWLLLATKIGLGDQEIAQLTTFELKNFDLHSWLRWRPSANFDLRDKYDQFLGWLQQLDQGTLLEKYKKITRLPERRRVLPGGLPSDEEM